jgi:hypothetical protein
MRGYTTTYLDNFSKALPWTLGLCHFLAADWSLIHDGQADSSSLGLASATAYHIGSRLIAPLLLAAITSALMPRTTELSVKEVAAKQQAESRHGMALTTYALHGMATSLPLILAASGAATSTVQGFERYTSQAHLFFPIMAFLSHGLNDLFMRRRHHGSAGINAGAFCMNAGVGSTIGSFIIFNLLQVVDQKDMQQFGALTGAWIHLFSAAMPIVMGFPSLTDTLDKMNGFQDSRRHNVTYTAIGLLLYASSWLVGNAAPLAYELGHSLETVETLAKLGGLASVQLGAAALSVGFGFLIGKALEALCCPTQPASFNESGETTWQMLGSPVEAGSTSPKPGERQRHTDDFHDKLITAPPATRMGGGMV